jgi:hypothetical protein
VEVVVDTQVLNQVLVRVMEVDPVVVEVQMYLVPLVVLGQQYNLLNQVILVHMDLEVKEDKDLLV